MILHNATAQYEAMTPPEPAHAHQHEHLSMCFDEADEKLKFLLKSIATFERHVPRVHQDRPEIRVRLNALCELIEDTLGEFGGRITYSKNSGAG